MSKPFYNLLLVEDDKISQEMVLAFLAPRYNVLCADSVPNAKKVLGDEKIDLILLDLSLKGEEDGLDLVRFMKEDPAFRDIPILVVTAHAFTTDRTNVLNAGCDDYLTKPFTRQALLDKIEHFCP